MLRLLLVLFSSALLIVSSQSTTQNPIYVGPPCQCNYSTVWLDLIFVIDGSEATSAFGFETLTATALTLMSWFNVQKTGYNSTMFYTQLGFVTYGNSATVAVPLGSVDNDDLENLELPFNGDAKTNLEAGIQAAVGEFDNRGRSFNVVKVIFVLATTFNLGGVNDPMQAAETFQENGGVLIVYNDVEAHGIPQPTLQSIASDGYFFSSLFQDVLNQMMAGLCDANCYCTREYESYQNTQRDTPAAGCYSVVDTAANYRLATSKCSLFNNAYMALAQTADKAAFLSNQFYNPGTNFYIQLVFENGHWQWDNGTPLGGYQPWAAGNAPNGTTGNCTFVTKSLTWQSTDCRNGYLYICEAPPCDSLHYCN